MQPGRFVLLSFVVFDIESYAGKCIDIVEVKDGSRSTDQLLGKSNICVYIALLKTGSL